MHKHARQHAHERSHTHENTGTQKHRARNTCTHACTHDRHVLSRRTAHKHTPTAVQDGTTPLLAASKMGHAAAVKALLDMGANVEAHDKVGMT